MCQVCQVSWSGPKQGRKAHVDRYKNSPVMHKSLGQTHSLFAMWFTIQFPYHPWDDLVYLPTYTYMDSVDFCGFHVGKYTFPMDASWKFGIQGETFQQPVDWW